GAAILKAGIPLEPRFGGILEMRNRQPVRFVELIEYSGCSLCPAEVFIAGRMTTVREAATSGDGKVLGGFYEFPALCRPVVENIVGKMGAAGLGGLPMVGETSEPLCEVPVRLNKVGMVLLSGLNPVAAAAEAGIRVVNHAMSGTVDRRNMTRFGDVLRCRVEGTESCSRC
ncbi:MAG: NrpR regulatory domain-containing protein, partial [Chloroflexi bacterium]|nr:NrpR regulatory domain-containing protein [Chloroflexota bacterium]